MKNLSPLLKRLRSYLPSAWLTGARLSLVLLLAVGSSLLLAKASTVEMRSMVFKESQQTAREQVAQVGMATMGDVYLVTTNETAPLSSKVLQDLEAGLDPACGRPTNGCQRMGGLFPLRKGVEQLAGYLAFALALISLAHGMFVGGASGGDSKIVKWTINFLCVWMLMYLYPAWDYLIYKQMSRSLVTSMENGNIAKDMVFAITGRSGDLNKSTPTLELESLWKNDLDCTLLVSQGSAADMQLADKCFGEEIPPARRDAHAQTLRTAMSGSPAQQAQFIETIRAKNHTIGVNIERSFDNIVRGGLTEMTREGAVEDETSPGWLNKLSNKVVGVVDKAISATISGFIWTIVNLFGAAVLWLVQLASIVARAVSFAFAPIAIVWSLAPTGGEPNLEKAKKWFKGHAIVALWPVGIHFGILLFYALNTAINSTNWVSGSAPQGLAIKVALFVGFITMCFKTGTLTKIIAGDIAEVAGDFGKAASQRTLQMAGTALKVGVAATGVGAVGMAGGMAAGGMAAKVGSVLGKGGSLGAKLTTLGSKGGMAGGLANVAKSGLGVAQGGSSLARKGLGGKVGQKVGRAVGKTANVAAKGTKMGYKATRFAYQNRVKGSEVPEIPFYGSSSGSADPRPMLRSAVVDPFSKARDEIRKRNEMRRAETDDSTANALKAHATGNKESAHELKNRYGIEKPSVRPQERVEVATNSISGADLDGRVEAIGKKLVQELVNARQIPVTLNVGENDGIRSYSLEPEGAAAAHKLMGEDSSFAAAIMERALKRYGKDEKIPRVAGEHGAVVDINALIRDDTETAQAFAFAAQASAVRDEEVLRREILSAQLRQQKVPMGKDSKMEIAIRAVNPEMAQPLPGEVDANGQFSESYIVRIQEMAADALCEAVGVPKGSPIDPSWWEAGSAGEFSQTQVQRLVQSMETAAQSLEITRSRSFMHHGTPLGLKVNEYIKSGGKSERYEAEADSLFQKLLEQPGIDGSHGKAYQEALRQIADAIPQKRNSGESDHDFLLRRQQVINEQIFLSALRG